MFIKKMALFGMGENTYGQLGLGDFDNRHSPIQILSEGVVHAVTGPSSFVIKSDGHFGQLVQMVLEILGHSSR